MSYKISALFERIDSQLTINPSLTLHDLARNLGTDRHNIEKAVREARHITFRQHKNAERLRLSLDFLVVNCELSIKETANRLGWSPAAFSRFIKVRTGKSPSEIKWHGH
jgi:transcriptional regulator GlxA family with amidase domain